MRLKGTPPDVAKRRFITYLSEINPLLIDVMPDEKPPDGFPLDRHGNKICAKCNTTVGCDRPLYDQHKIDLRKQLFECDEYHEPDKLRLWVKNALVNQRCIWGMHVAVTKSQIKPFMEWFNKKGNKGFFSYDSSAIMLIVRDVLVHYYEVAYDMMQHKDEYEINVYNIQAEKTLKLKTIFEELAGEEFKFEVPCTRTIHLCEERRIADGGVNHTHEVEIDPPSTLDVATFEEAVELRIQCQKLGINPSTGIVKNVAERCDIYRERIAQHFKALEVAAQAKVRNENRISVHADEKRRVVELSKTMIERQCWDACQANRPDRVMTLVRRGCDANEESPRGITPLICFVLNETPMEMIEELVQRKGNVNAINK